MFHIAHIYNYSMMCLEKIADSLGMRIERLQPDASIKTATSDMPELWFKMQKTQSPSAVRTEKTEYLKYFKTIEQNFLSGTNLLAPRPSGNKLKSLIKRILRWKK
jgi:hypothetical protein